MTEYKFYFVEDTGIYSSASRHTFGDIICMIDVSKMDDTDKLVYEFLNYFDEETPFYITLDDNTSKTEDSYGRHLMYVKQENVLKAYAALCKIVKQYEKDYQRIGYLYHIYKTFMKEEDIYIVLDRY